MQRNNFNVEALLFFKCTLKFFEHTCIIDRYSSILTSGTSVLCYVSIVHESYQSTVLLSQAEVQSNASHLFITKLTYIVYLLLQSVSYIGVL